MAAELEIDAGIHIGAVVGDKLDGIADLLRKKPVRPNYLKRAKSGVVPAAGNLILSFGHPPINKMWNITGIVAYGSDDHTAVASSDFALYTGDPSAGTSLAQLLMIGAALPFSDTISKDVLWAWPGESVYVNITAPAGTAVGANLLVSEWNQGDR
jgi:hypothetical protein